MPVSEADDVVMAIDPGRAKCGVAVVRRAAGATAPDSEAFEILHRDVVTAPRIGSVMAELVSRFSPDVILIGDGTAASDALEAAKQLGAARVALVDEKFSSLLARKRYFRENPPRGLRRLIPVSLQTPGRPYDDYVALILAERYLSPNP